MSELQSVRGTQDLLPEQSLAFRHINQTTWKISELYGFGEISTPIFEYSPVFYRTLGETSDIVNKETYTFLDRGGDSITLRPEGTAGIARAFISEGMAHNLPLKFFYFGPMFRYERPQKGRYRQFHQMGVEVLGIESYMADVEVIALAYQTLKELGLENKCKLHINTLGDVESRLSYKQKLVEYFTQFKSELSPDSLVRLEKNPLRILDSKAPEDQKIVQGAPEFKNSLNESSQKFFAQILKQLDHLKIPYEVDQKLVRGLDYYCHTVFEFITTELGSQGALLAGGRYDGLISSMGGPQTPGVGWASGIERLALLIDSKKYESNLKNISVICADDAAEIKIMELATELRTHGFKVDVPMSGNMGKKMKRANKVGSQIALIIGGNELEKNTVTLKNLETGEQKELLQSEVLGELRK